MPSRLEHLHWSSVWSGRSRNSSEVCHPSRPSDRGELEGPETSPGDGSVPARFYDPNQELYDPNYYGTAGQMGQMGPPPPGIIPSSVTGRHTSPNAPYSVTGMSAMSGSEMPGLLETGGEVISQAFPGSDPNEDWQKQGWDTQSTGEGGKWETEDSIFRRKKNKGNDPENYMAKYFMQLGKQISGDEDTGWRSK